MYDCPLWTISSARSFSGNSQLTAENLRLIGADKTPVAWCLPLSTGAGPYPSLPCPRGSVQSLSSLVQFTGFSTTTTDCQRSRK